MSRICCQLPLVRHSRFQKRVVGMTLVEFLEPLRAKSRGIKVLGVLYYLKRYESRPELTVAEIRAGLASARVAKSKTVNVSEALTRLGHYVHYTGRRGRSSLWMITTSGERHLEELGITPAHGPSQLTSDSEKLKNVLVNVTDSDAREYVEEAVKCLDANARRAAVVFLWSGVIRTLQIELLQSGRALTAAIQRHDPRSKPVSSIEHFAYVRDATTLQAAEDLGRLDKGEKGVLKEALDLRNRCGHPTRYSPGEKRVASFIEDVVGIVFA